MHSIQFIRLQAGFTDWLRILNFEPTSQRDMPKMLTEFLDFMEANDCTLVNQIQVHHIKSYISYLYHRTNRKFQGGLSVNYIRKQMQVLRKFTRYLTESGQESFNADVPIKDRSENTRSILTVQEIEQLYHAADNSPLGLRDKAMLSLYYGCGLRKNEGINVNVQDLQLSKELLYVRKGKGFRERYVPLAGNSIADLETYLLYGRPYLLGDKKSDALLLSINGKRLNGGTAYLRLQPLKEIAGITITIGLHTLRHSIATHLLESGMKLEQIQRFLGHSSLESTQIYTHLQLEYDL